MNHMGHKTIVFALSVCLLAALAQSALAQPGGANTARLFGELAAVSLTQLAEVQQALNLTDEQKTQINQLNSQLSGDRQAAFSEAAGDFDAISERLSKLYSDYAQKLYAVLQEPQQKRIKEIYAQINGAIILTNADMVAALKITDEQKTKLQEAVAENRQEVFGTFQDIFSLSNEERAKKIDELIKARDEKFLAILTDEQKQQFATMKGEKLEVNLDNLTGFGPG